MRREQIASKMGIRQDTVATSYTSSNYQSSDAELLRDKLGLTSKIIEKTFNTQQAIKTFGDEQPTGDEYGRIVFKSLGSTCSDPVLAKRILSKLHHDLSQ